MFFPTIFKWETVEFMPPGWQFWSQEKQNNSVTTACAPEFANPGYKKHNSQNHSINLEVSEFAEELKSSTEHLLCQPGLKGK